MKYILVSVEPIDKYPPIITVIRYLKKLNCNFVVCSVGVSDDFAFFCKENDISLNVIQGNYSYEASSLKKLVGMFKYRRALWDVIDREYNNNSTIWVFSTITLKHLGKRILKYSYILHLFELIEELPYVSKVKGIKIDIKKICKSAKRVIVCEYNRAHITKAWFDLDDLPVVLPNKPFYDGKSIKNMPILHSTEAQEVLNIIKDKKIILYQGILDTERPLDAFIDAIDQLGDDYAFVVMSGSKNIYEHKKSSNYYFIPFIAPPYHLEITSHAYIGVLSYIPNRSGYSSILNAVYCAPNKIYEYSQFSIPMIGNDIPGLKTVFEQYFAGTCFKDFTSSEIQRCIIKIEEAYSEYSVGAKKLYDATDVEQILKKEVLEFIDKEGK